MTEQDSIQQMQMIEQNLQNILMQKQAFQMEFSETQSSLKEMKEAKDDVFKIVGQLMIKTNKDKVKEELESKEKLLDLRIKSLEKQEEKFSEQLSELREKFLKDKEKDKSLEK
ncbi:MAG: prefoldin subunit beta [Candidatus Pacearchaeota archaeon]|nr:prefoldin subunit beta [Candidatus Pacearchaeota archaeon]